MKTQTLTIRSIAQSGLAAMGGALITSALLATAVYADPPFIRGAEAGSNAQVGTPDNKLAAGLSLLAIADGDDPIENPSGTITQLGFLDDTSKTRTEPDENTYLELRHNPGGPVAGKDYGRH